MGITDFFNFAVANPGQAGNDPIDGKPESESPHEVIGAAAGFEAMKAYEKHCQQNGKPASYELAKELIAGSADVEVDKLLETKGLDKVDKEASKRYAKQQAEEHLKASGQF